jgi:hypothetical protein
MCRPKDVRSIVSLFICIIWNIIGKNEISLVKGQGNNHCYLYMDKSQINMLVESIHQQLLPQLQISSVDPHDPVIVDHLPSPWRLQGTGNYAAVVYHPDHPDKVVKVYAPQRPGFEEEVEVYHRLGSHPAFSECLYAFGGVLVLKRLHGVTLYDCICKGLPIPEKVIRDIDQALDYARSRGLHPHDVHGRNVMMYQGRGLVVDVSDFLHEETCSKWKNLKRAYYWLYLPLLYPLRLRIPYFVLDFVRKSYRLGGSLNTLISQLFHLVVASLQVKNKK